MEVPLSPTWPTLERERKACLGEGIDVEWTWVNNCRMIEQYYMKRMEEELCVYWGESMCPVKWLCRAVQSCCDQLQTRDTTVLKVARDMAQFSTPYNSFITACDRGCSAARGKLNTESGLVIIEFWFDCSAWPKNHTKNWSCWISRSRQRGSGDSRKYLWFHIFYIYLFKGRLVDFEVFSMSGTRGTNIFYVGYHHPSIGWVDIYIVIAGSPFAVFFEVTSVSAVHTVFISCLFHGISRWA